MKLKVERTIKNFTQEKLAKKSVVCRTTISLIENKGLDGVKVDVVKRLANALGITVQELLNE